MLKIEKKDGGFLIGDKIMFNPTECSKDYINILESKGPEMSYGKPDSFNIDFPGEYDKDGYFFKVYEGDDGKLNYFIKFDDKRIALIITPGIIEKEQFENIGFWLYSNDYTSSILDKLELEGKRINLNEIEG